MAKQYLRTGIGATLLGLFFGSALIAWAYDFWIMPYLFNGATITTAAQLITGVLTFSAPALILLLLIVAWWLGYIGITFRGRRR